MIILDVFLVKPLKNDLARMLSGKLISDQQISVLLTPAREKSVKEQLDASLRKLEGLQKAQQLIANTPLPLN